MNKLAQIKELSNIDLSALLELVRMFSDESAPAVPPQHEEPRLVLIRTYSAGVHFGRLESRNGKEVTLTHARRVWYWKGANTLNELIANGPADGSKISEPTARVILTEAIEIIDMTPEQYDRLSGRGWTK